MITDSTNLSCTAALGFCHRFPELSVPKILGLFDYNENRDNLHLSPEIYMIGQRQKYNPQKNP